LIYRRYPANLAERAARAERTGKPGGKQPLRPRARPAGEGQVKLTDAESSIMPSAEGAFEHAYNAQANVDHFRYFAPHRPSHFYQRRLSKPNPEHNIPSSRTWTHSG
jgi:hypothetical protein